MCAFITQKPNYLGFVFGPLILGDSHSEGTGAVVRSKEPGVKSSMGLDGLRIYFDLYRTSNSTLCPLHP